MKVHFYFILVLVHFQYCGYLMFLQPRTSSGGNKLYLK